MKKKAYFIRIEKKIKICIYVKERGKKRYVRKLEKEKKKAKECEKKGFSSAG